MTHKRAICAIGILLSLLMVILSACIVNNPGTPESEPVSKTTAESPATTAEASTPAASVEATPEKADDEFPETLVLHPEATNVEISVATHTYVYDMPMLVADAIAYLEPTLKDKGWIELGKPTIMGHLATINLQNDEYRLNVSLQDNERSSSTRVQMRLTEK